MSVFFFGNLMYVLFWELDVRETYVIPCSSILHVFE